MIVITKRMRVMALLLALTVFAAMMPVLSWTGSTYAASSNYETEDNGNSKKANAITVNSQYRGKMDKAGEYDYYWFQTTEAGTITLTFGHEAVNSPSIYWKAALLDSDATTIITKDIAGNSGEVAFTTVGLPAGDYFVRINNSYVEYDDAEYYFNAKFTPSAVWETEDNDSYDKADAVAVNSTYYGNLMDGGDHDYYWFQTPSAGIITLSFNHDYVNSPSSYWKVSLIDNKKYTVISKEIAGNQTSTAFTKMGVPAGNYYIEIDSDWIEDSPANYNFKASFTPSAVWETENNDSKSDSDAVSIGTQYTGNLDNDGDDDYYWFKLNGKTKIKINFSHAKLNSAQEYWNITLTNKASGDIAASAKVKGNKPKVSLDVGYLQAGDYYLKIDSDWLNAWSDTEYSFTVAVDRNPNHTKITSVKAGKKKAVLKWKKSSDAKGYEIYRSTKKNGKYKKIKTIKKKNTVQYTNKKLKKNKKYYYKVRAYRVVGGKKYYSPYSPVKAVKVK